MGKFCRFQNIFSYRYLHTAYYSLNYISGAVRVGIMIFSTAPQVEFHLNEFSTKADVFAAIDNIPYIYGSTNTADALEMMWSQMYTARNGDRPGIPNTCVIITDGVSVLNQERTIPEALVSIYFIFYYIKTKTCYNSRQITLSMCRCVLIMAMASFSKNTSVFLNLRLIIIVRISYNWGLYYV